MLNDSVRFDGSKLPFTQGFFQTSLKNAVQENVSLIRKLAGRGHASEELASAGAQRTVIGLL